MNAPTPTMNQDQNMAAWAKYYHGLGLCVVPVKPGQKIPAVLWRGFNEKRPTEDQVHSWWEGFYKGHGIAIITGQVSGNIFVVDIDEGEGKEGADSLDDLCMAHDDLQETWTARTGGGGRHMVFRAPPGVRIKSGSNTLGRHIDTRGDGGLIIAPPSTHANGRTYKWMDGLAPNEIALADAPGWLVDLATDQIHHQVIKRDFKGGGTGSFGNNIVTNPFGLVIDGRDEYMARIIWATLLGELRKNDIAPGVEELVDLCWPTFEAGAKARGASLEEDGHTKDKMRAKIRSTLQPAKVDQARKQLQDTRPDLPEIDEEAAKMASGDFPGDRPSDGPTVDIEDTFDCEFDPETGEIFDDEEVAPKGQSEDTEQQEAKFKPLPSQWMSMEDILNMPDPEYWVEDLLTDGGLSIIYGKPGSFKSFLAMDIGFHVAYGLDWHGLETERRNVLYLCGEGTKGVKKRMKAWMRAHEIDKPTGFSMRKNMPILADVDDAQMVADEIAEAIKNEHNPQVVIIDTVSRTLGGGDENGSDAMGRFVRIVDHIKDKYGLSVVMVHHEGKNVDAGPRGSSVLPGAADTMIRCEKVNEFYLKCEVTKQKDDEAINLPTFRAKQVATGDLKKLKPVKSLVLEPLNSPGETSSVSPTSKLARDILVMIDDQFKAGDPLTGSTRTRSRYMPAVVSAKFGVSEEAAMDLLRKWLNDGVVDRAKAPAPHGGGSRLNGFRVLIWPKGPGD